MLHSLFVDLDLDLVFLTEILQLTLLVSELGLSIFELLLAHDPEVIHTLPLILI